jgi:hypothetical protein
MSSFPHRWCALILALCLVPVEGPAADPVSAEGFLPRRPFAREALTPPMLCSSLLGRVIKPGERIQTTWAHQLSDPGAIESAIHRNNARLGSVFLQAFSGRQSSTITVDYVSRLLEPWHETIATLIEERLVLAKDLSVLLGDRNKLHDLSTYGASEASMSGPICRILADALDAMNISNDVLKFGKPILHYFVITGAVVIDPTAAGLNGYNPRRTVVAPFPRYFDHLQQSA